MVTVYKRADGGKNRKLSDEEVVKASDFQYNPAVQAKPVSREDADKIRSKKTRNTYALGTTLDKLSARL